MTELKIETSGSDEQFQPGAEIKGAVGWKSDKPVRQVELRLLWYTKGKGSQDVEVVRTVFATSRGGTITPFVNRALFVENSRFLSSTRHLAGRVDGSTCVEVCHPL